MAPLSRLATYGRLLHTPAAGRLICAYLLLGVASTMTPVAFVLFARAATHSFASASLVLAGSTAGGLVVAPLRGRLVDRVGPGRAVALLAVPDVLSDAGFILAARAGLGPSALVALAVVAGAVSAPASTALRGLWSQTLEGTGEQNTGYAVIALLTETSYIAGPLLAGGLIALFSPTVAVAATAGLSFAGAVLFLAVPAARESAGSSAAPRGQGRLPALSGAGMRTVLAGAAGFGLTFGVLDVAFPAVARAHGSAAGSGILLSAFAVGSWVGGFLYGLRAHAGRAGARYPWLALLGALGLAPLALLPGLAVMVLLSAFAGLVFAPITTTQLALIDELAEPAHRGEAYSWLGTLYGAGVAAGAALAGQLISGPGLRAALLTAAGGTLLAALIAGARAGTLAPASVRA